MSTYKKIYFEIIVILPVINFRRGWEAECNFHGSVYLGLGI